MSSPNSSRRILIAEIAGAHGIRGDVLVRTYTEDPEAVAAYGPLTDERGRSFVLHLIRVTNKGVIARVSGIVDRNGAEPLRGTKLYIDRSKLPETTSAEFYHADLIGLRAVSGDGTPLGVIVSVQNFGAGDLLELKPLESSETEFIPFQNRWVPSVDLEAGTLVIERPVATSDGESEGSAEEP